MKGVAGAKFKKFRTRAEAEAYVGLRGPLPGSRVPVTVEQITAPAGSSGATSGSGNRSSVPAAVARIAAPAGYGGAFEADEVGWDVVYSDGACKGNGKHGSVAGIGVWWGNNDPR